jgi:aminoglycoside phosphotransferase (APT) family kinase protein
MSEAARPWRAEREGSPALARRLVEAVAPELTGLPVEPFGAGWDNTAYLVGGRVVFRFPRRELAVPSLETELAALPLLAPLLPLSVPEPLHAGRGTDEYPWPYASYEVLRGEVVAERILSPAQLLANAAPLGRFLAALHGQPRERWQRAGVPADGLRRLDRETRVPLALEMLSQLQERGALRETKWMRRAIENSLPDSVGVDTLVHGDLDARHLLCDPGGRVTGVIDWGDLHLGDPGVDLAVARTFLPPAARDQFLAAYGEPSAASWGAARFRGLHNSLHVLDWALDTGARAMEAAARQWLRHLESD